MVDNALCALAAVQALTDVWAPQYVASAGRVQRRFTEHAVAGPWRVIELCASSAGNSGDDCRRRLGGGRTCAVFQPHRYSRTQDLLSEFTACFAAAATVVVVPAYAAEAVLEGIAAALLCEHIAAAETGPAVQYAPSVSAAAAFCRARLAPGDTVLFLGAGNINA